MEKEGATATAEVEIEEPAKAEAAAPLPTREELKAKGWSAEELDKGVERGMVAKPEEKGKEGAKPEAKKDGEEDKGAEGGAKGADAGKEGEKKPEAKRQPAKTSLPDVELTAEQEAEFLAKFGAGHPVRGLYFRQKNERRARQAAQQEVALLKAKLEGYEKGGAGKAADGEEGDELDPDKPLTLGVLLAMREKERGLHEKAQAEQQERAQTIRTAQAEQEEYARTIHADFDDTVTKAKEVIQNLDAYVAEPWKRAKVVQLVRQLQAAASNADKIGLDEYHAAMIAYEIGQFHPEYGAAEDGEAGAEQDGGSPKDAPKAGVKPGSKMERAETVAQRRQSSASVAAGGGKRVVSVEQMTPQDFVKLDYKQRSNLKAKHPAVYAKLMRG